MGTARGKGGGPTGRKNKSLSFQGLLCGKPLPNHFGRFSGRPKSGGGGHFGFHPAPFRLFDGGATKKTGPLRGGRWWMGPGFGKKIWAAFWGRSWAFMVGRGKGGRPPWGFVEFPFGKKHFIRRGPGGNSGGAGWSGRGGPYHCNGNDFSVVSGGGPHHRDIPGGGAGGGGDNGAQLQTEIPNLGVGSLGQTLIFRGLRQSSGVTVGSPAAARFGT